MPLALLPFEAAGLTPEVFHRLVEAHQATTLPRLQSLWTYFRNPLAARADHAEPGAPPARAYRLGQERGLPPRLTGAGSRRAESDDRAATRREIVIENDIAWRIHTMVDFLFGRAVVLLSAAPDQRRRRDIERVLDAVWEASGGIALLNDMALLAHVYGHVDLLVRLTDQPDALGAPGTTSGDPARAAAAAVRIEIIDPTRAIPLQSPADYRTFDAFIIRSVIRDPAPRTAAPRPLGGGGAGESGGEATHGTRPNPAATLKSPMRRTRSPDGGVFRRMLGRGESHPGPRGGPPRPGAPDRAADPGATRTLIVTEVLGAHARQVYHEHAPAVDEAAPSGDAAALVEQAPNGVCPGRVPVVHIQNVSQPFAYFGLSEVEPLIPLQDELNTRLSDRANRVTMQSFKMYLAKGLEGFEKFPVGPGQLWSTDNPDAVVESFGGDAHSPSEDAHIEQIREALDKQSGVPPLASGVVRAKIGNLSSENALKITLMGLLSKTARKRVTYGRGLAEASRLVLEALDLLGILPTSPEDRDVRVEWSDPLPRDERQTLDAALRKIELGVPRERVLSELGYAPGENGIA